MHKRSVFRFLVMAVMAVLLTLCSMSLLPTNALARANGPSLEETFAWLTQRINNNSFVYIEDGMRVSNTYRVIRAEVCKLGFGYQRSGSTDDGRDVILEASWELLLGDLNPDRVSIIDKKVDNNENLWFVFMETTNAMKSVKAKKQAYLNGTPLTMQQPNGYLSAAEIAFRGRDEAERFANALRHAIVLCDGRREPF